MAHYKPYNLDQFELMAIDLRAQILPGSFEAALSALIDTHVDFDPFSAHYNNDDNGATAYHPAVMLKILLYAYSQGLYSSRRIERACRENLMFMALSGRASPDHSTLAAFISDFRDEMISVFRDVLWVADQEGLIGRRMFAIDGCKLPSNASKEWSGTLSDYQHKIAKLETAIGRMIDRHRDADREPLSEDDQARQQQQIDTLRRQVAKLRAYMANHDERIGASGKPVKSNVTDPESAKIKTSKGVIQGYTGVTCVDDRHQIIVGAQAQGVGQEQSLLLPMVEHTETNLADIGDRNPFKNVILTADAGYHSERNLRTLEARNINAYIADNRFRKRDPRFQDADRFKPAKPKAAKFTLADFLHDEAQHLCLCPAGKRLYLSQRNAWIDGQSSVRYTARKTDCEACHLRAKCLKDAKQKSPRQVAFFKPREPRETASARMQQKIDSDIGRHEYSKRLGTVEPPYGHIQGMGFRRFQRRGQAKVNAEWLMICTVHNMKRIHQCRQRAV